MASCGIDYDSDDQEEDEDPVGAYGAQDENFV